jgi:alkylhydroperoxidase family enzyme
MRKPAIRFCSAGLRFISRRERRTYRHCERSEAIQEAIEEGLDCFVALLPRNDEKKQPKSYSKGTNKMARLPYLEADQVAPEYRDMLKRNTNLHKLLVNSPDMARAFNGVGGFIRFKSKLDPRLRELAILQVGWMEKSEYEFTHHVKIGKEFGVTDADIEGLMAETAGKPSALEPLVKAILKGAREMVRELAMSEATFAEIKEELSNEHMTDLVLTIAFYCAVVRVLATMKIDNEPYYKEVLQQYPIPGVK